MTVRDKEIRYQDVMVQVGRLLMPDWIDKLTSTERWILREVRRRRRLSNKSKTLAKKRDVPIRQDQIDSALQREAVRQHQRDRVDAWLDRRKIKMINRGSYDAVSKGQLERALAEMFPSGRPEHQAARDIFEDEKPTRRLEQTDDQLANWAHNVCLAVSEAGKRVTKGDFEDLAWKQYGRKSLTSRQISTAFTAARTLVGWPAAGKIPAQLKVAGVKLQELLASSDANKESTKPPHRPASRVKTG